MKLQIALDQTGLTWTLDSQAGHTYVVGSTPDCDIFIPYSSINCNTRLELSYRSFSWYARSLDNNHFILLNQKRLGEFAIAITTPTLIHVQNGFTLKIYLEAPKDKDTSETSPLITSTRLLSGYAYLKGLSGSLKLLDHLRQDPYKANIPESSLDSEQIATHAAQSVGIALTCIGVTLGIILIQILAFITGNLVGIDSTNFIFLLSFIASIAISCQQVYFRWYFARRFLRKYYKPDLEIKYLRSLVKYFKSWTLEPKAAQNIIVFDGPNPFLGAGEQIPSSNWVIPINRRSAEKKEEGTTKKRSIYQRDEKIIEIPSNLFYKEADLGIEKLNLPALKKLSYLFVDGFELDIDGKLLTHPTSRPGIISLDDPLWVSEASSLASTKRAYRLYRYVDPKRDYVLSYFLRFFNAGSVTFVESSAYILTGIDRQRFSLASVLEDNHHSIILKTILLAIALTPGLYVLIMLQETARFIGKAFEWSSSTRQQERAAKLQEEYSYGHKKTLREHVAEPLYLDPSWETRLSLQSDEQNSSFNLKSIRSTVRDLPLIFTVILLPLFIVVFAIKSFKDRFESLISEPKINFDYYGAQDVFMYWKAIQTSVFRSTLGLLEEYGVDISEFEANASKIIDNSISITAGSIINSGQFAVGSGGSKISQQQRPSGNQTRV